MIDYKLVLQIDLVSFIGLKKQLCVCACVCVCVRVCVRVCVHVYVCQRCIDFAMQAGNYNMAAALVYVVDRACYR